MVVGEATAVAQPRFRTLHVNGMAVLTVVAAVLLAYLLLVPLAMTIVTSFRGPEGLLPFEPQARTTLEHYASIYGRGGMWLTLRDTAIYVGGSVLLGFAIGFLLAWLVERTDLPMRHLVFIALLTPSIIPMLVRAQAWLLVLSPQQGFLNQMIRAVVNVVPFWHVESGPINPFSMGGMVLVTSLSGATFFFLLLSALLRNVDTALEEASATSGASALASLRRITLPLLLPGILAAIMLNLIITLGQFEIPLLYGVSAGANIFSLRVWLALQPSTFGLPNYGEAAAYGVNFLLLTYALFAVYARIVAQSNKYATVAGKGYRPTRVRLGAWKYPALAFLGIYVGITLVLPFFTLVWQSLFQYFVMPSWSNLVELASLDAYVRVLRDGQFWGGLWRTLFVAGLSATIAVSLAVILAWVVARGRRTPVTVGLDLCVSSSVAIPATIVGFSLLLFYLIVGQALPLLNTIWILVVAYAFRTSLAYRITYAGVLQINRELEEAAAASGATQLATFRRVLLPLLTPHLFVAWIQLFLLGANEFTIAVFLSTGETAPLPVVIFQRLRSGEAGLGAPEQAAAMSVLFTIIVVAMAAVLRRLAVRGVQPAPLA